MGRTSPGGNGGACCGELHGLGGVGKRRVMERERHCDRIRGEKMRTNGTERVADGGRGPRSEELGEQIIARLRGMSREHAAKEKAVEKGGDRLSSASLVERAAARDTKNWEDESDDEDNCTAEPENVVEKEEVSKGKGKLVDV